MTIGKLGEHAADTLLRGAARFAAGEGVVDVVPRSPDLRVPLRQRLGAEQPLAQVGDDLEAVPGSTGIAV